MSPQQQVPVRRHVRRRGSTRLPTRSIHRRPPEGNRLAPRIAELREALDKRVGAYGAMKGVPISEEAYRKMENTSKLDFEEHAAFQDTQTWAHASGILSFDEAQLIYNALGEVGSEKNGGWASHTDLATKIVVQQTMMELLRIKIQMKGGI